MDLLEISQAMNHRQFLVTMEVSLHSWDLEDICQRISVMVPHHRPLLLIRKKRSCWIRWVTLSSSTLIWITLFKCTSLRMERTYVTANLDWTDALIESVMNSFNFSFAVSVRTIYAWGVNNAPCISKGSVIGSDLCFDRLIIHYGTDGKTGAEHQFPNTT